MCGIVGAVGVSDVVDLLMSGLKRLEYRGYDSAGVAVFDSKSGLKRCRAVGKLDALTALLKKRPLHGSTGIAQTRWATHGVPTEENAHPHSSLDTIFLVHNGIIENHDELRSQLAKLGYEFATATDTEVVAHLIHSYCAKGDEFLEAVAKSVKKLVGAYALAIMHSAEKDRIIVVRSGSPLVVGLGEGKNFIASDALALLAQTKRFIYLDEGDIADVTANKVAIYNASLQPIDRPVKVLDVNQDQATLGNYTHFMQKEIFEQAQAVAETLEGRISNNRVILEAFGARAQELFAKVTGVQITACGSSYHAALVGCHWLEHFARLPARAEIASEYRYRKAAVNPGTLFITISQSGETADTLAALRHAKKQSYLADLTICNVPNSSLVRESAMVFMTHAGIEIGVATTKGFTTQLVALLLLSLILGKNGKLNQETSSALVQQLQCLPAIVEQVLALDKEIESLAEYFVDKQHAFFLGRNLNFPIAMEGALKLKEISYIHAESYPAGELKHGPLALIEKKTPVVVVMPNDKLVDKLKSNLHEVKARHGELFIFADGAIVIPENFAAHVIKMPQVMPELAPIIYTIPLQILAYHVAALKGTDIDKPRNLAKSVTVE